jgi:hypothetical protein
VGRRNEYFHTMEQKSEGSVKKGTFIGVENLVV